MSKLVSDTIDFKKKYYYRQRRIFHHDKRIRRARRHKKISVCALRKFHNTCNKKIGKNINIIGYLNILFLRIDRATRQKISKDIQELENIINQLGQTKNYKTLQPYIFFGDSIWKNYWDRLYPGQ